MTRPEFIDRNQLAVLAAITVTGTTFLALPRVLARYAGHAAWLAVPVAGAGGLVLIWLLTGLARRCPDLTPVEAAESLLGPFLGKLVGLALVAAAHFYLAVLLREFSNFFIIPFMPETPISVFLLVMVLLLVYGIHQGLTGLARSAQVFLPVIVLSLLLVMLGPVAHLKVGRLLPWLGYGTKAIGLGAWHALAYVGELFLIAFLLPSLRRKEDFAPALVWGLLLSVFFLSAVTAIAVAALGADTLRILTFPTLSVARLIGVGPVFERFEVVLVVVWFILSFLKLSVLFYIALRAMATVLSLSDHRPLAYAVGTTVGFLAILPPNQPAFIRTAAYFHDYGQYLLFGVPAFLLLAAVVRRKGGV